MTGLNRCLMLCVYILTSLLLNGQNTYLNKKVNLPTGQIMLKMVIKSISSQTGCVFSYDPTKIEDKKLISISTKGNISLRSALLLVLPKNILFKLNGKYIVLQEAVNKPVINVETTKISQQTQHKSSGLSSKGKGTIDKNTNLERLVLPPLKNNIEIRVTAQNIDTLLNKPVDLADNTQKTIPNQQINSNLSGILIVDPILKTQLTTNEIQPIDLKQTLYNKEDTTTKIVKPGFNDFMNKNGYMEMEISVNKQLGAVSIHPGLYNVYAIISIGSDYNKSYLFGFGAGIHIKIDKQFSLDFDLLRNSIIAGKSYLLKVRASNTQIIPILNYSIGSSYKIFAGPTVNLIKSSYISSISTTDLGAIVGIGFSLGIKVDLKNLLSKQI